MPVGIEKNWELTHDQITLEKKLGEGAFGEVHSGKLKLKNKRIAEVAVKVAKSDENKEKLKELMREAKMMRSKLFSSCDSNNSIFRIRPPKCSQALWCCS